MDSIIQTKPDDKGKCNCIWEFPGGESIDFSKFPGMDPNDIFLAGILALNAAQEFYLFLEDKNDSKTAYENFKGFAKRLLPMLSDKSFRVAHHLEYSFLMELVQDKVSHGREATLYPLFQKNVSVLIPGAKIVPTVCGDHGRPDFCVSLGSEILPVEVKSQRFINTNIKQLRRYMNGMGASHGYAVAPILSCVLPPDMTFVPLSRDSRWPA